MTKNARNLLTSGDKIPTRFNGPNSKHFVTLGLQLNSAPQSKGYACRGTNAEGVLSNIDIIRFR